MATRNYVPRANGEGSIGTEKKHWGGAFFDKLAVKTLEVIGGGTENDAQPATVGWVREYLKNGLEAALKSIGVTYLIGTGASYVSFGKAFGNLVIQWGTKTTLNATGTSVVLPVTYKSYLDFFTMARVVDTQNASDFWVTNTANGFEIKSSSVNTSKFNFCWLTVGSVR